MTLRRKLLLVALCTLALPVAGWLYVRQMETLLREGQAQALLASANAVARSLVVTGAVAPTSGRGWYVQPAPSPITIDGYGDDWAPLTPWSQSLGARGKLLLAADDDGLCLYADVRATRRTRADADDANALAADHLILALGNAEGRRRYLLASAAPGPLTARPLDPPVDGLPELITAQWQEDGSGYRVELRLPRGLHLRTLGVGVYDAAAGGDRLAADARPLLSYSDKLSGELAQLVPDRVQARVLAPQGWLLARSGRLNTAPGSDGQPGWFAALVYRSLLATRLEDANLWAQDVPRLDTREVAAAGIGKPVSVWRSGEERGSVVLAAAVPIEHAGQVDGVLLLEQASRTVPLLANRALFGLLLTSFGVLLVAGGILLLFATRLSLRLGRLRNAAEHAQLNDGRLDGLFERGKFPMTDAPDEIGDLARSFERLFEVVGSYTDYLRTLASKLSHELNTPLAIVKSSLDNLEHAALPAEAQPYLARARDGVARLGALVRAMSESSRMERAIAAAEPEDVDLREVVRGCADAYRPLIGARRLDCMLPDAPLHLHCAPELVAQALDKLLDNALSFTPPDGWLRLTLRGAPDGAEIELANQGPPLPAAMQGRLFDSLVSLRDKTTPGGAPHLGLGLYVVRLVAERHAGVASARNLDDGSGVAFSLVLCSMPRSRLCS
ncbi:MULTISPECIES: ATP-binding protein [Rhodanobacter]|uniref:ATP-binding protein n=1 Tax=Rhodanobacter TaxID=75309 RepID=UPI00040CC2A3|nr:MULTISPECIES: ATP-binding protein [Rhodanobacter]KZC21110.1 histidine kinase [Rhodanobacter denitrificans]UJJ50587.1 ATP-binding protein [Rhodanobacter denitrificans]UJM93302.1 ATP-binding protein [Rhodanobacter denitrificans]UJM96834.1 ATP-binding protein [Rhodanobacter denitrificans]UJN20338.1 ATP-binding protein [Rhodanobacter denitrificans]